jgi:hypothetical protein
MRHRLRFALSLLAAITGACAKEPAAKEPAAKAPAVKAPGTTTIDRAAYSLNYPSAWTLDKADKDFDLDSYFSIDINEGCHESFLLFDVHVEPKGALQAQLDQHLARLFKPGAAVEHFNRWGAYTGEGGTIRGRLKPLGTGTVRLFVHAAARRSVILVEFCFDEDLPAAKPGFAIVEESFRLK